MALFLDSANPDDATRAQKLGFVSGITTNPQLFRDIGQPSLKVLESLVNIFDGHVFYQLTAETFEGRIDEAWQAYDLRPDRVVIQLPATTENLSLIKRVQEIEVAITAIYNPLQAYAAAEAGAHYVIPYVNRATEMTGNGLELVTQIATLLKTTSTEILADSLQSHDQALRALEAGANHVTLPLNLLLTIGDHPLSDQTIEEWQQS